MPNKTGIQVEVYYFKRVADQILYLLLKRTEERGGFWQPLTGGNEEGESLDDTIAREGAEEIGLDTTSLPISSEYDFSFYDNGREHKEYVYGVELSPDATIRLSDEHTDYRWVNLSEALALLKWEGNKEGLLALSAKLG